MLAKGWLINKSNGSKLKTHVVKQTRQPKSILILHEAPLLPVDFSTTAYEFMALTLRCSIFNELHNFRFNQKGNSAMDSPTYLPFLETKSINIICAVLTFVTSPNPISGFTPS